MQEINTILEKVRTVLRNEMPKLCQEANLPEIEILDVAPDVAVDEFKMGVYLASPSGEVFDFDLGKGMGRLSITLDLVVDRNVSNSNLPEQYLSLLIVFLLTKNFGYASYPQGALTSRVDIDCPANAAVIQLISVINYVNDLM